jgi:hypothetical protein
MSPRPLVLAALTLACAPADRPAEPPRVTPAAPVEPVTRAQPTATTAGEVEEYRPDGAWIGVAPCDAYLELYRKCEPELAAEIAAGDRRSAKAEAGRLKYSHEHEKDPDLPAACESMLAELRRRCPQ